MHVLLRRLCKFSSHVHFCWEADCSKTHYFVAGIRISLEGVCLVLEYWGQCLRQPFRRQPLNLKWVDYTLVCFGLRLYVSRTLRVYFFRLKILHQLGELHRCGFHHGDFAERNILERNGDIRIIDFDEMTEHNCQCDMNFRPGEKMPDEQEFGCPHLWELCRYSMKIWDLRMSFRFVWSNASYSLPLMNSLIPLYDKRVVSLPFIIYPSSLGISFVN